MTTARDIIKSAMRKIHVLGTGTSLDATEANDALGVLNSMLSTISAQGQGIYADTTETFSVTGATSYTIGSGGDFNTVRPIDIKDIYFTTGGIDYPLRKIDGSEYSRICLKTQGSDIPEYYYYDNQYPLANIYFYEVPSSGSVTILSVKPLTQFSTLDTDFAFPPEYLAMLEYNLAVWLAPEYEREANPTVQRLAINSLRTVKIQNRKHRNPISVIDAPNSENGGYGHYNINRGY